MRGISSPARGPGPCGAGRPTALDLRDSPSSKNCYHQGPGWPGQGPATYWSELCADKLTDLESPADPGALVLRWFQTARRQECMGVLVPAAIRKIVPQYSRRCLRLLNNSKCHIGFGQSQQCLLDMPRRLVARDHDLESVDRTRIIPPIQIKFSRHDLPAGELIAGDCDLSLGRNGILGRRIFANHLVQPSDRFFRSILIARNVADLIKIGTADQELRIGRIRTARMQLDITPSRADRVLKSTRLIIRIG